jgi:hypothetical protein
MLDEKLQSKIDLLKEQIDNIEKSGYYTDAQIQVLAKPLRYELSLITDSLSFEFLTIHELRELQTKIQHAIVTKHHTGTGFVANVSNVFLFLKKGTSSLVFPKNYQSDIESKKVIKRNHINDINVIDAEILTPNYQPA